MTAKSSSSNVKAGMIRALTDLGFTPTQARAYTALCELGRSGAKTISRTSQIARQDIYRVLAELEKMGFVKRDIDMPVMFEPVPLEETFKTLMDDRDIRSRQLQIETHALIQDFQTQQKNFEVQQEPQFLLIPRGKAYASEGRKAIEAARSSVECVTTRKRFLQMMLFAGDEVNEALRRGVEFRFILDKPISNKKLQSFFDDSQRRNFRTLISPTACRNQVAVFDKRKIQVVTSANENFTTSSMFVSTCPQLVSIIDSYFHALWSKNSTID